MLLFEGNPCTQGHKILSYFVILGATHSKNFVSLARTILTQYRSVTDRRMDILTMAMTCEAFCCHA